MIFCPRTFVHPPTVTALDDCGYPWTPVELPAGEGFEDPYATDYDPEHLPSRHAYVEYFRARWTAGESFVNVEHDTLITADQMRRIVECPEPWCSYTTDTGGKWSLNLAKFTDGFIAEHQGMWDGYWTSRLIGEVPAPVFMAPKWFALDNWLLMMTDRFPHTHDDPPGVINVHPFNTSAMITGGAYMTQLCLDRMSDRRPYMERRGPPQIGSRFYVY